MTTSRFGITIILILFLSLVSTVGALVPDSVILSTNQRWVTVGSTDSAIVSVRVINATYPTDPVIGAGVMVWCEDSNIGNITPVGIQYVGASSTNLTFTFKPGTKSGNATLHANVTYPGLPVPVENTTIQRVDHAAPTDFTEFTFPSTAPVGTTVTIAVRFKDRYGNIVNSLREADENRTPEVVSFRDSEDYDGGFWNGTGYSNNITIPVNTSGYAQVLYHLASIAGDNVISLTPPAGVTPSPTFLTIRGYGTLIIYILSAVTPPSGIVHVGGDTISILYTVTDDRGNPIRNANVVRTTTIGEVTTYRTNDEGQVMTYYGPKGSIGSINLTATVEGYPGVRVDNRVEFVHSDPSMWVLTASPQTLASRDVKDDITADIKAKIMDDLGNPVENESVSYAIVSTVNTTRLTTLPSLVDTTAVTDIDGFATILFRPGAFPLWGQAGYNQTATGTSTVRATWGNRTKDIQITFKNYPYLRVETNVFPQTVGVNETVDVTVRLIGDGWALRPKPIDVVLVTDRSGSMLKDEPDDRMVPVKVASKAFAQQMDLSQSQDHIGLVSFGTTGTAKIAPTWSGGSWNWNSIYGTQSGTPSSTNPGWWWVKWDATRDCSISSYSTSSVHHQYVTLNYNNANPKTYADYAVVDNALNWSASVINSSITSMVPSGGTPMRYGIYKAINEIDTNGRSSAVRAIIVLSDGDYNYYGDPLARGTGYSTCNPADYDDRDRNYCRLSGLNSTTYNLSRYAIAKNVKIYSIGYAEDISADGKATLRTLAESTGGKYYDGDAANIGDIYRAIAGELRTAAGVNTRMNLSFQNINVTFNNATTTLPGEEVFQYQYVDGVSTRISSWNLTVNPLPGHVPAYPYTVNQSTEWNSVPPHLYFDVGNVSINQTWQTIFRLKIQKPGNINIFGSGSAVTFDGVEGNSTTLMPQTFVTAIENLTLDEPFTPEVDVTITGTNADGPGVVTDLLRVYWNLSYDGNKTVKQDLYFQFSDDNVLWTGTWVHGGSFYTSTGPLASAPFSGIIDVRDKSGWMKIKVTAKEQLLGGGYDEDLWPFAVRVGSNDKVYIQIS